MSKKTSEPIRKTLPAATLVIRDAAAMSDGGADQIVDWLKRQLKRFSKERGNMAKTYRATFEWR